MRHTTSADGTSLPFHDTRVEGILVLGGEQRSTLTVRETVHGPILDDMTIDWPTRR